MVKEKSETGIYTLHISLRTASDDDVGFARNLYFETMREIIERLFGWDQSREEQNFARFFRLEEVRIITADGQDVGWIQEQISEESIHLGSLYVAPAMQGRGIGTQVLEMLLARAAGESKAVTLAVVKINNPARQFYEKRGFQTTHEDEHKFYMKAAPKLNAPIERKDPTGI
jgi:GNAT superfamily N-acetyltransferase